MTKYHNYMEDLKRRKGIIIDMLVDTRDMFDGIFIDESPCEVVKMTDTACPNSDSDDSPPHGRVRSGVRQKEVINYGMITFDTTAVLHHYPQKNAKAENSNKSVQVYKSGVNSSLDEIKVENNNDFKLENKEIQENKANKENCNNNDDVKEETKLLLAEPVTFAEEKLV